MPRSPAPSPGWQRSARAPDLDAITAACRAVVACGAASYLEAARYPTTSGLNDSSYPGVLWGRSRGGLLAVQRQLAAVIGLAGPEVLDVGPTPGPFAAFPDPQ